MGLYRWRSFPVIVCMFCMTLLLLAACGDTTTTQTQHKPTPTPSPSPTPGPGQQLLSKVAQALNTASTLHGIFNLTISGSSADGIISTEIWNEKPGKSRTEILQSTISQFAATGAITVSDGKQLWQYDPQHNVVYTGPVTTSSTSATPTGFGGNQGGQNQFLLNIVQSVFTQSTATLTSSSASVNGHSVYDVYVVPQVQVGSFNYKGDIFIDKTTQLPIQVKLDIASIGHAVLDLPTLVLNQSMPAQTFTFVTPAGAKVLPLQDATPASTSGTLSLVQAQQQAGYHLLSIPADQADYTLNGVDALGTPGSQTYTLNYMKGNSSFIVAQGKPLANLPTSNGQSLRLRGTTATLVNANGTRTLSWTEKGIGIQITGSLSEDQLVAIAGLLA